MVGGQWKDGLGLAWDPLGRCEADPDNFQLFSADKDDFVLMQSGDAAEIAAATSQLPHYDKMRFAAGCAVDLNGDDFAVPDLEGYPTITSGNLTVTNSWTVDAAEVAAGAKLTAAGKFALGADAKIVVVESGKVRSSPAEGWTIAEAEGGIELPDGWQDAAELPEDGSYGLKLSADGKKLVLTHVRGAVLIVR